MSKNKKITKKNAKVVTYIRPEMLMIPVSPRAKTKLR